MKEEMIIKYSKLLNQQDVPIQSQEAQKKLFNYFKRFS